MHGNFFYYGLLWHFIYIVCGGCVTVQLPHDEIVSLIFHYTFQIKMICVSPGKECIYIHVYKCPNVVDDDC